MILRKSQTATEYLIITAVVIIIALIVVNVLGGIPGLGSGISEQQARLILQTQTISISDYAVSDYDTVFTLTNNHPNTVRIDTMSINGEQCLFFYGTVHQIRPGRSLEITCQNVYELESDTISWPIQINWTDISNDASYSQEGDDVLLVGSVSNKYLNVLQSNDYWNDSIDGCHDDSVDPIPICTCVDLNKTRDNLDENHTMQNSIDFNRCLDEFGVDFTESNGDGGWEPIGKNPNLFQGNFDGGEFVIANLFIDTDSDHVGLFGDASYNNVVLKNIGLSFASVTSTDQYVGGLVGDGEEVEIINSFVGSGFIKGQNVVGGLIGSGLLSKIENSYVSDSEVISDSTTSGGLLGNAAVAEIINSRVLNTIVTGGYYSGGLAGEGPSLNIINSYAQVRVYGTSAGGLVGGADLGGSIDSIIGSYWINYTDDNATQCVGDDSSFDGNGCTAVTSIKNIPIR